LLRRESRSLYLLDAVSRRAVRESSLMNSVREVGEGGAEEWDEVGEEGGEEERGSEGGTGLRGRKSMVGLDVVYNVCFVVIRVYSGKVDFAVKPSTDIEQAASTGSAVLKQSMSQSSTSSEDPLD